MEEIIKTFLNVSYGYGSGSGSGYGDGSGDGDGNGSGSGYGDGSGDGYGSGYGDGYGSGSGYGDGSGDGDGNGSGSGYGDGSGDGYGSGYGDGNGNGLVSYNTQKVYIVDGIQTLIHSVHSNYAKGSIINSDLTLEDCYIAKVGDYFAHGETLQEAFKDATEKYEQNKPIEERIASFKEAYPSLDSVAEHKDLYSWHHVLTGSCTFGRDQFAKEHNLDKNNGTMSIRDFISLTENAFGSDAIRQLKEAYN